MLQKLEAQLFHTFKDKQLLKQALSHKSHANEGRKRGTSPEAFVQLHNERLEFLGDSVLGLVITDLLTEKFSDSDEGKLSKMRSSLVKAATLAAIARSIDLGSYLLLGKGELSTKGNDKDSILSSTYEAVLGAVYLDGGLPAAFEMVKQHFAALFSEASAMSIKYDTKTQLQEISQARFRKSPTYKVASEEGPDHEKQFEVMVSIGSLKRFGKGKNKKEAEQAAARFLLDYLLDHPNEASETRA